MLLSEIIELVNGTVLAGSKGVSIDITSVCSADLLSNILRYGKKGAVLITGLNQTHVIRSAEIADIPAVIVVLGRAPEKEMIAFAEEKNIVLISTHLPMYTVCGMLFVEGLKSCVED